MRVDKKEVLAIIPARGGSKGIPRKNIIPLCGKPLIAHTIEAALDSRLVTRVVVSTEDPEIGDIAKAHGAEVPFLRPKEMAQDHSNLSLALGHTLDVLMSEGYHPWAVTYLFATSPIRPKGFIDFLLSKLYEGHQSVQTVRRIFLDKAPLYSNAAQDGQPRAYHFRARDNGYCFRPYGNMYACRLAQAPRGDYIHYLTDPAMCIDIDLPEDLHAAETAISQAMGHDVRP